MEKASKTFKSGANADDAPQNSNGRPGVAVIKNRYKSSVGWKIALVYITFIVCCNQHPSLYVIKDGAWQFRVRDVIVLKAQL